MKTKFGCHCGRVFMNWKSLKMHRDDHPKKPREPRPVKKEYNYG